MWMVEKEIILVSGIAMEYVISKISEFPSDDVVYIFRDSLDHSFFSFLQFPKSYEGGLFYVCGRRVPSSWQNSVARVITPSVPFLRVSVLHNELFVGCSFLKTRKF